ncbi:MAG TPA: hypothetical protein VMN79_02025 [Casimicrobiaceae bacterium]|nr:hypothetical protein [Casimicrobiaceae bacterium]
MKRTLPTLFVLVFSLLIAGMQVGAKMHVLEHVGEALRETSDHSLIAPHDEPCPICALSASGSHAVTSDAPQRPLCGVDQTDAQYAPASIAPAFRSYYQSRAPPTLL